MVSQQVARRLGGGAIRLEKQTILITGASSGLGRGLALALSHGQNRLIVTARREALLRELAEEVEANGSTCRIELKDTDITFVAHYPGFTRTPGLDPEDVPVPSLIIDADRAVREMLRAIERGKTHHMFPRRILALMTIARWLPEPLRRRILQRAA